jgi:hypothetical protein
MNAILHKRRQHIGRPMGTMIDLSQNGPARSDDPGRYPDSNYVSIFDFWALVKQTTARVGTAKGLCVISSGPCWVTTNYYYYYYYYYY